MKLTTAHLLLGIVLLAAVLRLVWLGDLPVILNRDEAAIAYNAVLLKETGQDEWQRSWPLALESFGDFKLPGYPWLVMVAFTLFGYADWVVRLPSALAGVGLVVAGFFLARVAGLEKKYQMLLALVLALTPVLFFYSRIAFEANVALLLFISMLVLLLSKVPLKKRHLLDVLAIGLALYASLTYNTPLLLLPFVVVLIPFIRGLKKWREWLLPVAGLGVVFVLVSWLLLPLTSQKQGITIFSDEAIQLEYGEYRQQFVGPMQKILGNRYVYYLPLMMERAVSSVSPHFLVQQGGSHPWHQLPGYAHLYWSVWLLGWVGVLFALVRASTQLKQQKLQPFPLAFLYLTVVALLPSVVTVDSPHATRSLLFMVLWCLWAVVGVRGLAGLVKQNLKHPLVARLVLPVVILALVLESSLYFHAYFTGYPEQQGALLPGFDQQLAVIEAEHPNLPVAVVDPDGYHYILLAWYLRVPPSVFFETVIRQQPNQIGFRYGQQVGRYHFIGAAEDRQESEQVLLEWDGEQEYWILD